VHLILIAIIVCLLLFIVLNANYSRSGAKPSSTSATYSASDEARVGSIAFLSNGKLFRRSPGVGTEQISSPYIQEILNNAERRNTMHGWKQGTSFEKNFIGTQSGELSETAAMSFRSAGFIDKNTMLYFLSDGSVGGLFEQNLETGEERRLVHQQRLDLDHFHYDANNDRVLCSSGSENGIRNLASFNRANNDVFQYTEGDTIDALPCSYPGQSHKVIMQSSGIARGEDGYLIAVGPASLNVLSIESGQLETVVESDLFDYMHPAVHPNGDLYYIRRPFETPRTSAGSLALDIALFPFRVARAVFHYLNFFSLMYTKKPLTSAAGPEVQRDRNDIIIQGKRIDAEKAQRREGVVRGVPSLVPSNWELVSRNRFGQETVVANHVVSFAISTGGHVIYTNGFGVFELSMDGPSLLFRDSLIEKILVR